MFHTNFSKNKTIIQINLIFFIGISIYSFRVRLAHGLEHPICNPKVNGSTSRMDFFIDSLFSLKKNLSLSPRK
jgi:hypothetical protein